MGRREGVKGRGRKWKRGRCRYVEKEQNRKCKEKWYEKKCVELGENERKRGE